MEVVTIISKEIIKPSSNINDNLKPFKINLLDQIVPATYIPFIFFYPSKPAELFTTRLKNSLSKTLTRFYPFSGRLKNNLFLDDFHSTGVPFLEARVNSKMSTFFAEPKLSLLNHLLPCLPLRRPNMTSLMHQVAVQVNEFNCGGIAIGVCASHKIADATSFISFISNWAAATRQQDLDNEDEVVIENDDLSDASLRFPAMESFPERYSSMQENLWFTRGNFRTERFVFDAKALAALKESATGDEQKAGPSRVQALTGFIWKSVMAASSAEFASPSPRTCLMFQAVNLRRSAQEARVGNMLWVAVATYNEDVATAEEKELPSLVEKLCESIAEVKDFFIKPMRGEEAVEVIGDMLRLREEFHTVEQPEIYECSSLLNMGLDEVDFGLGRPVWVGTFGEVGPEFRNFIVLKDETMEANRIEAWATLDEKVIAALANDPNFLAFCSINPPISIRTVDEKSNCS